MYDVAVAVRSRSCDHCVYSNAGVPRLIECHLRHGLEGIMTDQSKQRAKMGTAAAMSHRLSLLALASLLVETWHGLLPSLFHPFLEIQNTISEA